MFLILNEKQNQKLLVYTRNDGQIEYIKTTGKMVIIIS